jgi:hypothetical protein
VEYEKEPHECDQRQLVEKQMRHHGHAPSDGSEMRALYRVFALSELSAGLGYTTKTHLQHLLIAVGINLKRVMAWVIHPQPTKPYISPFAALVSSG